MIFANLAICAACDGAGPVGQPFQESRVSLELLTVRPLLGRPWGLALDPTGRYLVVSSHINRQLYVLDAETYGPVGDTIGAGKVRGIEFAPSGTSRMFVAAEGFGVLTGDLSPEGNLTLRALDQFYATFVLQDERAGGVYAVEPGRMLVRLAPDGSRLASQAFYVDAFSGLATSRDGELVLAIAYDALGQRLLALDADDLALVAAVEVPPWARSASYIVPLDGPRAVVIGGSPTWFPTPGPLVAIVDWEAGTIGATIAVGGHREGFFMGYGNPWVQMDPVTALIGTTQGILTVDTRTGETSHVEGDFADDARVNECCSMVWDAGRRRLVVASSVVYPDIQHEIGRLEVYRIR